MGRQVYFSTGQKYKFRFAVQDSTDILEFGGFTRNARGQDLGMIQWSHKLDFDFIVDELTILTRTDRNEIVKCLQQDLNPQGTLQLFLECEHAQSQEPETIVAKIALGFVIAHQLLQDPELTAEYEAV